VSAERSRCLKRYHTARLQYTTHHPQPLTPYRLPPQEQEEQECRRSKKPSTAAEQPEQPRTEMRTSSQQTESDVLAVRGRVSGARAGKEQIALENIATQCVSRRAQVGTDRATERYGLAFLQSQAIENRTALALAVATRLEPRRSRPNDPALSHARDSSLADVQESRKIHRLQQALETDELLIREEQAQGRLWRMWGFEAFPGTPARPISLASPPPPRPLVVEGNRAAA
jgi:hypothetical protein